MFTAKVSQMDYRASLKQVKKFDLEDKDKKDDAKSGQASRHIMDDG